MQNFDSEGNSFLEFILQPANGRCEREGGTVVVSVEGEPHTYQNANQAWREKWKCTQPVNELNFDLSLKWRTIDSMKNDIE